MVDRHVYRLPFARFEDDLAVEIRARTAKTAQVHDLPRHDRVHRQTIQKSFQRFELPLLNAATRLHGSEIDFNLPADTVVRNNLLHLLQFIDRQRRNAQDRAVRLARERYLAANYSAGAVVKYKLRRPGTPGLERAEWLNPSPPQHGTEE
jgi:hypothetical protein